MSTTQEETEEFIGSCSEISVKMQARLDMLPYNLREPDAVMENLNRRLHMGGGRFLPDNQFSAPYSRGMQTYRDYKSRMAKD